jgi:hypothetical protein
MYNTTLPPHSLDRGAVAAFGGDLDGEESYYDCVDDEGAWGFKAGVRRPTEDEALAHVYREQAREAIERALSPESMLTDGQRDAVRARYEGHGKKETAELLGLTLNQAGNFYCRGVKKAQVLLADFEPLPGRAYRGVTPERALDGRLRWGAYVWRRERIGTYDTSREAALAYDRAARERFGAEAQLNFPAVA